MGVLPYAVELCWYVWLQKVGGPEPAAILENVDRKRHNHCAPKAVSLTAFLIIFSKLLSKKKGGGELEFGMYFNVLVWNLVTFLDETVDVPFGVLKTLCWPR